MPDTLDRKNKKSEEGAFRVEPFGSEVSHGEWRDPFLVSHRNPRYFWRFSAEDYKEAIGEVEEMSRAGELSDEDFETLTYFLTTKYVEENVNERVHYFFESRSSQTVWEKIVNTFEKAIYRTHE